MEIELKLVGNPVDLPATFAAVTGDRYVTRNLVSTYYDTADGSLWRRGFTLRVRERQGAHELTLKQEGGSALKRGEWTVRIENPTADIGLLPPDAPRAAIGAIGPGELQPRFLSDIERRQAEFGTGDALLEVSLDIGRIVAGERQMSVAELEFELLGGPITDMLAAVRSILQERRLVIGVRSKASRGMDLVRDAPPAPVKATGPDLRAADTVDAAVAKVIAVTTMQLMGNLAAAGARQPEGVHQLRVSLRRLRSALAIFKAPLIPRAGDLTVEARLALKRLGPARDMDVFLLETLPRVADFNAGASGLTRLHELAEERQAEAYEQVRRLLADQHFSRFILDLLLIAEGGGSPAGSAGGSLVGKARRLLSRRHRKVVKAGQGFARLTQLQRHDLRLALKELRYACDYFQILFPGKAKRPYVKRLAGLQDDLGTSNDATVASRVARKLAAGDRDGETGVALVTGWSRHRLRAVEPHLRRAWRQFAEAKPFWLP